MDNLTELLEQDQFIISSEDVDVEIQFQRASLMNCLCWKVGLMGLVHILVGLSELINCIFFSGLVQDVITRFLKYFAEKTDYYPLHQFSSSIDTMRIQHDVHRR